MIAGELLPGSSEHFQILPEGDACVVKEYEEGFALGAEAVELEVLPAHHLGHENRLGGVLLPEQLSDVL